MSQTKLKPFAKKSRVQWKWLGRIIEGVVEEIFVEPVQKTIKGKNIKRNGSPQKPAYLVKSEAGGLALKLHSELSASPKASGRHHRSLDRFVAALAKSSKK